MAEEKILKDEIMSDTELDHVAGGNCTEVIKIVDVLYFALKKQGYITKDANGKTNLDVSDLGRFLSTEMGIKADFGVGTADDATSQKAATFTSVSNSKKTFTFDEVMKQCQNYAKDYA